MTDAVFTKLMQYGWPTVALFICGGVVYRFIKWMGLRLFDEERGIVTNMAHKHVAVMDELVSTQTAIKDLMSKTDTVTSQNEIRLHEKLGAIHGDVKEVKHKVNNVLQRDILIRELLDDRKQKIVLPDDHTKPSGT